MRIMKVQHILVLFLGLFCFSFGQLNYEHEVRPVLPPDCAAVSCMVATCPDPIKGRCCPICKQDCRLVKCGQAPSLACPIPKGECCPVCKPVIKPGTCPQLRIDQVGHCAELCSSDGECPGKQKCCSVGCGRGCMDPVTEPKGCLHNGHYYNHGESFKIECNTCTCRNGFPICTTIGCNAKPGTCPQLRIDQVGHCAELCSYDGECPGKQKCCSVGCGRGCMDPVKPKRCFHNGQYYNEGQTYNIDCNTCTCLDGAFACTEKACLSKPGKCPPALGPGICVERCSSDDSCKGRKKCCSNGCGHVCMNPKSDGPDCSLVDCPPLPRGCHGRSIKPPGQCCRICLGNLGYEPR